MLYTADIEHSPPPSKFFSRYGPDVVSNTIHLCVSNDSDLMTMTLYVFTINSS